MSAPILVLIGSQLLFTVSDLLGRLNMVKTGFTLDAFLSGWFLAYTLIRIVATFGQLYVLSQVEVGRTVAIFGAGSIVASNVLGWLVLKEVLTLNAYIGVTLAIIAFFILAFR